MLRYCLSRSNRSFSRFQDFFDEVGYYPTLRKYAALISKLYDANIPISGGDADKVHARILCINKNQQFDSSLDPGAEYFRELSGACRPQKKVPMLAATQAGEDIVPDLLKDPTCLPDIALCEDFIENAAFLNAVSADVWCGKDPSDNGYSFAGLQGADIDYDDLRPEDVTANDKAYVKRFSTFAITLLHEPLHIDSLAQKAGEAEGKPGEDNEAYERSICREVADRPGSHGIIVAEENAENHALAWHGKSTFG